jgi:hypothetical protein
VDWRITYRENLYPEFPVERAQDFGSDQGYCVRQTRLVVSIGNSHAAGGIQQNGDDSVTGRRGREHSNRPEQKNDECCERQRTKRYEHAALHWSERSQRPSILHERCAANARGQNDGKPPRQRIGEMH